MELLGLDEFPEDVSVDLQSKISELNQKQNDNVYDNNCKSEDSDDYLAGILKDITDFAFEKGLIKENTVTYRDLFDTKLWED